MDVQKLRKLASNGQLEVGILGSGFIGRQWAMLFAAQNVRVKLYDVKNELLDIALDDIKTQLTQLEANNLLRGSVKSSTDQLKLIRKVTTLEELVQGSIWVQECCPEIVELKQKVFTDVDKCMQNLLASGQKVDAVIASSTSCILPSRFQSLEQIKHSDRMIVAHPVNPCYYVKLVELVPNPKTSTTTQQFARNVLDFIEQKPVVLTREVEGFSLNRIQYAIINEVWNQVKDGLISPADVDTVMRDGLGPRYAFMGVLETIHLNANGVKDYIEKYGKGMEYVSSKLKPTPSYTNANDETCTKITQHLNKTIPLDTL